MRSQEASMRFARYSSIENSYREKTLNYIRELGLTHPDNGDWVVLEKVHGANFSIWVKLVAGGPTIKYAKRSGFLGEGGFFNYHNVVGELQENISEIVDQIYTTKGSYTDYVVLCGELAGGTYPHPEIAKSKDAKKVQDGVYYSPDNFFYMFDIKVDGQLVDHDEFTELAEQGGVTYAKELFRGSFNDCLEYPNDGVSTIPERDFGLPPIDGNIMEGVVIKPTKPLFLPDGSRVILKNKNNKFSEVDKEKKVKAEVKLSDTEQELLSEFMSLITENRLKNVISKEGEFTTKDFGKLLGLLVHDAYMDFCKDHSDALESLEKPRRKLIQKVINKAAGNLIRPLWLNIIDGVY